MEEGWPERERERYGGVEDALILSDEKQDLAKIPYILGKVYYV
jgi:hypothetical protein